MCERNAAIPEDPVRFFGFDVQQQDEDSVEIRAFLETWAPDDAPGLLGGLDSCLVTFPDVPPSEAEHSACLDGLDALGAWAAAHESELVASAGERATRLFGLAAVGLRAAQDQVFLAETDVTGSFEARDVAMGTVFQGVLDLDFSPDVRVAIWAHNIHLSMAHDRIDSSYAPRATTFGAVIADAFGDDYAAVAITGYAPGTNWPQIDLVEEHSDLGTSAGSVESRLGANLRDLEAQVDLEEVERFVGPVLEHQREGARLRLDRDQRRSWMLLLEEIEDRAAVLGALAIVVEHRQLPRLRQARCAPGAEPVVLHRSIGDALVREDLADLSTEGRDLPLVKDDVRHRRARTYHRIGFRAAAGP